MILFSHFSKMNIYNYKSINNENLLKYFLLLIKNKKKCL